VPGMYRARSKSRTWEANFVGKRLASKCWIGPTPLLPSSCPSMVALTLWPSGVTAPIPVITTRRRMAVLSVGQAFEPDVESGLRQPGKADLHLPNDRRGALAQRRVGDLQDARPAEGPGLGHGIHGAFRGAAGDVHRRRHGAALQHLQADGQ